MTPTPCKQAVIALEPCPFCGGRKPRQYSNPDEYGRPSYGFQCTYGDCWVCGPEAGSIEEAATKWNTRHLASQPSSYEAGREKGTRYRHVKRGGIYRVVGRAQVQADDPLTDYEIVTVYRDQDGELWVRRKSEFEDGRFEPVEDSFAALPADVGAPDDGSCVRCSAVPRTASGLCNTCLDEDAERAGEIATPSTAGTVREALEKTLSALKLFRSLVNEGGVPRYTVTPGAALNSVIEADVDPAIERAKAALSAPVEAPVAVRPLEWEEGTEERSKEEPIREPNGNWEALCSMGIYSVEMGFGSDSYIWSVYLNGGFITDRDDPESAKAAAQADYEQRIRSALIATPRPLPSGEDLAREKLREIVSLDEHGRYGRLAKEVLTLLGGSAHG